MPYRRSALFFIAVAAAVADVRAGDVVITDVQAAAIELPQTAVLLRRPEGATPPDQIIPIHVLTEDPFTGDERNEYAFPAFLDTGTSGTVLSLEFADFLGIQSETASNGTTPVNFFDVTVDGEKKYGVSEPLYASIAPFPLNNEPEYNDLPGINSVFTAPVPIRMQMNLEPAGDDLFAEPRNVMGMPALAGKTMVVDATSYTHFDENSTDFPALQTTLHGPNDPTVPVTDHTVRLSYADFSGFTRVEPDPSTDNTIQGPTLAHNPIIGRNPLVPANPGSDPPGVTISRDGAGAIPILTHDGNYLLDTGAQVSFISSLQALALHVEERDDGTGDFFLYDTDTNQKIDGQFSTEVMGTDNSTVTILGFVLDSLTIPAEEGNLIFTEVPVFVLDVALEDAQGHTFLLDGDIGMNLFLPSLSLDFDKTAAGFDFMVFDEPNGELRLTLVPEPATTGLLVSIVACGFTLPRARRRRRAHAAL